MADYQDILKYLASNPPRIEPEKKFHASLLEMLAKKLRGEAVEEELPLLKKTPAIPSYRKNYH